VAARIFTTVPRTHDAQERVGTNYFPLTGTYHHNRENIIPHSTITGSGRKTSDKTRHSHWLPNK